VRRPRRLSDEQVAWLLQEYDRYQAWRALRQTGKSQRRLAQDLGASQATISLAIRPEGQYRQGSHRGRK
jgi:transposase